MKKILATLLVALTASTANAASSADVVGGVIGGMVLGSILTRPAPQPVYQPQPPVVYAYPSGFCSRTIYVVPYGWVQEQIPCPVYNAPPQPHYHYHDFGNR